MPPMTVVSPSFTSTSVSASRFEIEGWPFAPVSCGLGALLVALILRRIEPSAETCGVTLSSSFASMKVVFTPEAETCENGIEMPCPIVASLLSMVAIFGAEMVFTTPVFSSAERRRFRLNAPPAEPRMRPMRAAGALADRRREAHRVVRRGRGAGGGAAADAAGGRRVVGEDEAGRVAASPA